MSCHGKERQGSTMFGNTPALTGLKDRKTEAEVVEIIQKGKGVMPAFSWIENDRKEAILAFLFDSEAIDSTYEENQEDKWPYPYVFGGYQRFYGPGWLSSHQAAMG